MTRTLSSGTRLVVASHNKGKVWEINQLIAPYGLDAVSAGDLSLDEPEETETTFAGNARLKAVAAAKGSGLPALADDSGLEVDCLGGAPGIYSARWAGPGKDFSLAMKKVAEEITARHGWVAPGPRANFVSVLCLAWPDGTTSEFEGKVFGHLVWPPRGGNGFGYDPMFVPEGDTRTFGEMEPVEKYAISHRTRAFAAFKAACLEGLKPQSRDQPAGAQTGFDGFAAAAASLSTREEFVQFLTRIKGSAGSADVSGLIDRFEKEVARASNPNAPAWRIVAEALAAALRR